MKKETHTSHEVQMEGGDVAYVKMPQAEHDKKVTKSIMLRELIKEYIGKVFQ
jgi:hypothetical protein